MTNLIAQPGTPALAAGELRYPYRPKWLSLVLGVTMFTVGWLALEHMADTNDRGLILFRLIELSPPNAALFYRGGAWLCLALVGVALLAGAARVANPQTVRLTAEGISIPRYLLSQEPTFVRFADVRSAVEWKQKSERWLAIEHPGGKLMLRAGPMPSRADYGTARDRVLTRVEQARHAGT